MVDEHYAKSKPTPNRNRQTMTTDGADETSTIVEGWGCKLIILISVVLHTASLLNVQPLQSANDRSRWCTVWSLVERQTFQIDEIRQQRGWDSIDIIFDNGHYYSTKPPLLSVVVAGVTWCVQRATGWTLLGQTQLVTAAVLFVVNIVPFGISLILLARLLRRIAATSWSRLFILSTAAFGTLVTPFLMTLNNHTVAVAGVIVALYALERILTAPEQPSRWMFAICGAASAWVVANELPAAALALATFLIAFRKSPKLACCWYVPAAMIPLAAFMATNVIATGSWKPTYAGYGTSKYQYVIDGVPSYWMQPHGVDRNLDPPWLYFIHCTVGHHGILSLTPVFLLAIAGWMSFRNQTNPFLRTVLWLGAALNVLVLAFFMTRTQNYNFGGVSCALRWENWLIPFWLLGLVPILDATARSATFRLFTCVLLAASMVSSWLPINNPWQQPWLFRQMERWGWIDYRDPPVTLPRTIWTWFPSIPKLKQGDPPAWVEYSCQQADGSVSRRRLTVNSPANDNSIVEVQVQEAIGSAELQTTRRFSIDVAKFDAGASTADFMSWTDPAFTLQQQMSDMTFVRGVPLKREYHPGRIHYLKTSVRRDAFRCHAIAAAVDFKSSGDRILRYRCDAMLCDELPFGVAQVEYQITDPETREVIRHEVWTVTSCQPEVAPSAPAPRR